MQIIGARPITSTVAKVGAGGSVPATAGDLLITTVASDEVSAAVSEAGIDKSRSTDSVSLEMSLKARLQTLVTELARVDEIVEAYADLARFYLNNKIYDKAEQVLEEVLSYGRESYGAQHPAVAPLFIELAFVNYHRDNFVKARLLLESALFIQEREYGEVSEQAAFIVHKLGRIAEATADYNKAEQYYLKAVTIYQNTYIEDDSQIISARADLARVRRHID